MGTVGGASWISEAFSDGTLKVFIQDRIFFLSFSKEERTLWVCCCPSLYSRYSLVNGCFVTVVLFFFFPAGLVNVSVGLQFHQEVFWFLQHTARGCDDSLAEIGLEDRPGA